MSKICSKCQKAVYPLEELKCLDKVWHKLCFKCTECGMLLNMKNYKGYDKRPYCVAHYPKAKATSVAETPELARVAQNTKQQSLVKYHEEFEKKIKGSKIEVTDDPETQRVMKVNALVSQLEYTGRKTTTAPPLAQKPRVEARRTIEETNGDKFSPFSARSVTNSTVYSSDGNKAVRPPQKSGRVGSIADYDPMNENYGSLCKGYKPASRQTSEVQDHPEADDDAFGVVHKSTDDDIDAKSPKHEIICDEGNAGSLERFEKEREIVAPEKKEAEEVLVNSNVGHQKMDESEHHHVGGSKEHHHVGESEEHPHVGESKVHHVVADGETTLLPCRDDDVEDGVGDTRDGGDDDHRQPDDDLSPNPTAEVLGVDDGDGGEIITTPLTGQFVVLYDYEAQDDDEVSFVEDDVIVDVEKIDEGWLLGTVARTGQRGMLPANYVQPPSE